MTYAISPISTSALVDRDAVLHEQPRPRDGYSCSRATVLAGNLEHRDLLEQALDGEAFLALSPGEDPISAISAWLQGNPSNELHLVAHGAPGQISLGQGLDRLGLLQRAEQIGRWGVDRIYLWSCRVGADLAFVSALQELSGARVFASAERLGLGKTLMGSSFPELAAGVAALPLELAEGDSYTGYLADALVFAGANNGSANADFDNTNPFVLSDLSAAAADLNALNALTSGDINATSVTTLTGSLSDVTAAYTTAGVIGLGDEAVTLSGTSVAAESLNSLNALTSGDINAASVTTLTGSLSDVTAAYTTAGVIGLGDEAVTLSDTTASAGDLNSLDSRTSGLINAGSVGTLTGTAAAIDTAINASTINTGSAVTININDGSATVAQANSIDAQTTGVVTATINDTAISTLGSLTGTGNAYSITVSDASVTASALNTLDDKTTIAVNTNAVNSISGTASEVTTAFNSAGISNLNIGNDAVTVTDTSLTGSDPTALDTGSGTDTLSSTSSAAQTLNLSSANSGSLGSINFTGLENVTLGAGADTATIAAGGSLTSLNAGAGADTLNTNASANSLTINASAAGTVDGTGISGFETINTLAGNDSVTVNNSATALSLNTGDGTDSLTSTTTADNLTVSGANAGSLGSINFTGLENVTLGAGADTATIAAGGSLTSLNAGAGADTLNTNASANSLTINASAAGTVDGTGISNFETINTLAGDDSVTVNNSATALSLNTGDGTDSLTSTTTADNLTVSGANAGSLGSISFTGLENVTLGAGADTATIAAGGSLTSLNAGAGADTLNTNASASSLTINASATGIIDGTAISNFETINTGGGEDSVIVNDSATSLRLDLGGGDDSVTSTTTDDNLTVRRAYVARLGSIDVVGVQNVTLGAGADTATIAAGGSLTSLNAGAGADTLNTNASANSLTINASAAGTVDGTGISSFETINTLAGDDSVTVNNSATALTLNTGDGTDSLTSTTNADNLTVSGANAGSLGSINFSNLENVTLGAGADTATIAAGGALSGNLNLGDGNNTLTFNSGAGTLGGNLNSGSGNDSVTFDGGKINGSVDLGAGTNSVTINSNGSTIGGNLTMGGTDTLSYAGYTNPVNVSLSSATSVYSGNATAIDGYISGLDNLVGGSGSGDTLNSQWGYNTLSVASNGTATLDGALTFSSFENINLGAYNDTATIDGAFQGSGGSAVNLNLGYQNDTLTINNAGSITGSVTFGGDYDTLNYGNRTSAVTATYTSGTNNWTATSVGGTVANDFERIITGAGGDTITATGSSNALFIDSGAGNDTISGSNAADTIYARTGTDNINGGDGNDQIRFADGELTSADTVDGGSGYDKIAFDGPATVVDSDFTKVTNVENIDFTNGTNSLTLAANASTAAGTTGNSLRVTTGSESTDSINASAFTANLTTNTGGGNDSITGGSGADTFEFISANLTADDLLNGGTGTDQIKILGAAVVEDSDFTKVTAVETLALDNTTNNVTLGINAATAADTSNSLDATNNAGYLTLQGGSVSDTFTIFIDGAGTADDGVRGNVEAFGGAGDDVMTVGRNAAQLVDSAPGQLNLHGGDGYDVLTINGFGLNQFNDFTRDGELGEFIYFAAVPTSETMDSDYFNMKLDGFDKVNWDKTPTQSVSSTSELSLLGASGSTISSGASLDLAYNVAADGGADATSVSDGTSAFNSSVAIGTKKTTLAAAEDLGLDTSLDVGSVVTAMTSAGAANAFSVGFSIGMDRGGLTSAASLDASIANDSLVSATAQTTTGQALAVASNDADGITGLAAFSGSESVSLAVELGLDTESIAATTAGNAEAVGWMGASGLENTTLSSSGLGLIDIGTMAGNAVAAEAVTGAATADAFSSMAGISGTNFNFADTDSSIAVNLAGETSASATSILGNAISNLTSSVMGFFGNGTQNQITGVQSVDAIVSDHGFSEAASVGGSATSTATQSAEALSGYTITTSDELMIQGKTTLDSSSSASVVDA